MWSPRLFCQWGGIWKHLNKLRCHSESVAFLNLHLCLQRLNTPPGRVWKYTSAEINPSLHCHYGFCCNWWSNSQQAEGCFSVNVAMAKYRWIRDCFLITHIRYFDANDSREDFLFHKRVTNRAAADKLFQIIVAHLKEAELARASAQMEPRLLRGETSCERSPRARPPNVQWTRAVCYVERCLHLNNRSQTSLM